MATRTLYGVAGMRDADGVTVQTLWDSTFRLHITCGSEVVESAYHRKVVGHDPWARIGADGAVLRLTEEPETGLIYVRELHVSRVLKPRDRHPVLHLKEGSMFLESECNDTSLFMLMTLLRHGIPELSNPDNFRSY